MAGFSADVRPLRRVRPIDQVRGVMEKFECSRIDWPDGSYGQMVGAGVGQPTLPAGWAEARFGLYREQATGNPKSRPMNGQRPPDPLKG